MTRQKTEAVSGEDLFDLATSVAEKLARVPAIRRVPALGDYRLDSSVADAPRVVVDVDLGRGLVINFHVGWRVDAELAPGQVSLAELIFRIVEWIDEAAPKISPIQRMAKRRIANAQAEGLTCSFISAEPVVLNGDRGVHPRISIEIEALDGSLRPGRLSYEAESRKNAAWYFDEFDRIQALRAAVQARLARLGATAAIDAVLLNALRKSGIADAELLRTLRIPWDNTTNIVGPDGTKFDLRWQDGCVMGSLHLDEEAYWYAGTLSLRRAPKTLTKRDLGRRLVDIYPHPLLEERTLVNSAWGKAGREAKLHCSMMAVPFHLEQERFTELGESAL